MNGGRDEMGTSEEQRTLGDWLDEDSPTLEVTFHAGKLPLSWESCSEVADFVSRYAGLIVASAGAAGPALAETEATINYILNELVENGYKFSSGGDVDVRVEIRGPEMVLYVRNRLPTYQVPEARAAFRELLTENPQELFLRRIEENAAADSDESGLGFLTILNDYGAELAWRFDPPGDSEYTWLTTMARFTVAGG